MAKTKETSCDECPVLGRRLLPVAEGAGVLWGPFCENTNSTMAAGVHVSFADTDIQTRAAVSTVKSNVPPFERPSHP